MDTNLPDIEDLFKSALDDDEEAPSPKVWEKIDQILDKDEKVSLISLQKKYNNLKKAAFLLLFLLTGLSIYELERPPAKDIELSSNNTGNSPTQSETNTIPDSNNKSFKSNSSTLQPAPSGIINGNTANAGGTSSGIKNSTSAVGADLPASRVARNEVKNNTTTQRIINSKPAQNQVSSLAIDNNAGAGKISAGKTREGNLSGGNLNADKQLPYVKENKVLPEILKNPPANAGLADTVQKAKLVTTSPGIMKATETTDESAVAKSIKIKNSKPLPFAVNIFWSPDFASYRLQDDQAGSNAALVSAIEKNESHKVSSTIGALLNYKIKKHWSLQSGVTFSRTDISIAPETIYAQPDNTGKVKYRINTSSGYGYVLPTFSTNPRVGDSVYAFSSEHTLHYIGIPVGLMYTLSKGRFSLNAAFGVSVNILHKAKIETEIENGFGNEIETVDNIQGMKPYYLGGQAGVGIDYNFNRRIALSFQPTYRFALNAINKDVPVLSHPHSLGLLTGLRFSF